MWWVKRWLGTFCHACWPHWRYRRRRHFWVRSFQPKSCLLLSCHRLFSPNCGGRKGRFHQSACLIVPGSMLFVKCHSNFKIWKLFHDGFEPNNSCHIWAYLIYIGCGFNRCHPCHRTSRSHSALATITTSTTSTLTTITRSIDMKLMKWNDEKWGYSKNWPVIIKTWIYHSFRDHNKPSNFARCKTTFNRKKTIGSSSDTSHIQRSGILQMYRNVVISSNFWPKEMWLAAFQHLNPMDFQIYSIHESKALTEKIVK